MGRLVGYIKGKEIKVIVIINPKVIKAVIYFYYNYEMDKETRNSVSGLANTLRVTLLTSPSNTKRTVALSSTEANYMALSACAIEVKFVNMLLEEMTKIQNPSVTYEDKQGAIFFFGE